LVTLQFVIVLIAISSPFTDSATTQIYTLSLHDALPIFPLAKAEVNLVAVLLRLVARNAAKRTGGRGNVENSLSYHGVTVFPRNRGSGVPSLHSCHVRRSGMPMRSSSGARSITLLISRTLRLGKATMAIL